MSSMHLLHNENQADVILGKGLLAVNTAITAILGK